MFKIKNNKFYLIKIYFNLFLFFVSFSKLVKL